MLISRLPRLASLTHSAPLVLACRVSTLHGEAHFFLKVSTQDSSTCMSTYEETAKLPAPCRQSSTLARMVKTTNRNDATVTKPFFYRGILEHKNTALHFTNGNRFRFRIGRRSSDACCSPPTPSLNSGISLPLAPTKKACRVVRGKRLYFASRHDCGEERCERRRHSVTLTRLSLNSFLSPMQIVFVTLSFAGEKFTLHRQSAKA